MASTVEPEPRASKSDSSTAPSRTLVDWDGPNDPSHPKNWPTRKKWTTLLPMSLFNFLSSMSSATMAPALADISKDLHFSSELQLIFSLSVFLLGTAVVPLLTAPLSEVFGRSLTLQTMNLFYIIFNTLCGIAKTPGQLIGYRFLAGLGGAGPFAVCSLQVHDAKLTDAACKDWQRHQRRSVQAA